MACEGASPDRPGGGAHGPAAHHGARPAPTHAAWLALADERLRRRALIAIAIAGLAGGLIAELAGLATAAHVVWWLGVVPVAVALAVAIVGDLVAGRMGVDAIALVSMVAALALGQPLAGAVVAVMYAGGGVLEDFAVTRAEGSLKALIDRAPRLAHRRDRDTITTIASELVRPGDRLVVKAGEIVPVDGRLADAAVLDEQALTGEAMPVTRGAGETARSGAVNAGATFEMTAAATAGESTYAGIVRMVTAAQTAKAPFIRMADKVALYLLPATLAVAGLAWAFSGDAIRGLAVLVAATPCPLILAAPVAFIAGVSQAARRGVLVKGGGVLEALARAETVLFDKTGTLTVGGARLVAIETAPGTAPDDVLRAAASLEQASQHVVAQAVVAAARARGLALQVPADVHETMGSGLEGTVGGRRVAAGSHQLVYGARAPEDWARRTLRRASWRSALSVFVSIDGAVVGALLLADELRPEAPRAVHGLRAGGVKRVLMVTGDRADAAETIGAALDLDAVLADRVPSEKVDAVATERKLAPTLMVGDGINDAPALAAADVGVAMGARGATASSEAADVVMLVDRVDRVADAVAIARRARAIAVQSIAVGLGLSGIAMAFAAFGLLSPVAGAVAQEAIDVAVILNALRALTPGRRLGASEPLPAATHGALTDEHRRLSASLDRLRGIADALDDADAAAAAVLIRDADRIVADTVVAHERDDEAAVYPRLARHLADKAALAAMSRAHREIQHRARLLGRLAAATEPGPIDRYLIRDAQRVIEAIEALVRLHNAQEEDIYEHAAAG